MNRRRRRGNTIVWVLREVSRGIISPGEEAVPPRPVISTPPFARALRGNFLPVPLLRFVQVEIPPTFGLCLRVGLVLSG